MSFPWLLHIGAQNAAPAPVADHVTIWMILYIYIYLFIIYLLFIYLFIYLYIIVMCLGRGRECTMIYNADVTLQRGMPQGGGWLGECGVAINGRQS